MRRRPAGGRVVILAALAAVLAGLCFAVAIASGATFVTAWGSKGSGHGQFNGPYGVAVDGNGHVYVADTGNQRIEKFSQP